MIGSLVEAQLFESMEEDEECDYDHTLIDKENYSVGEGNSNICKDVVIEMELMQAMVLNDLHEDVELQSELRHALDVSINELEKFEMPSQSNVKWLM